MTKPDRIEAGNQEKWHNLLQNRTETLEQGWFCVRLPFPEELKQRIGRPEARRLERIFFEREPWISMPDVESRLSVENLMQRLSEILAETIAETCVHHTQLLFQRNLTMYLQSSNDPEGDRVPP